MNNKFAFFPRRSMKTEKELSELEKYNESLNAMHKSDSDIIFANDSDSKGTAVAIKILETSKNVKIFVDSIQGSIYNNPDFIDALRHFLSNGNYLEMIICDFDSYQNKYSFFKEAIENHALQKNKKSFILKHYDNSEQKFITFMTGDEKRFRIDVYETQSLVCFNMPERTKPMSERFDEISAKSVEI